MKKLVFAKITEVVAHLVPVSVCGLIEEIRFHEIPSQYQDMNLKVCLNGYVFSVNSLPGLSISDPDGMFDVAVFGQDNKNYPDALGFAENSSGYITAAEVCKLLERLADLPLKISKAS
jgi:hypothetical protein